MEKSNLEDYLSKDAAGQKTIWQRLDEYYFRPKSFEKSGRIYEILGCRLFGKYWINGGSYWSKRWGTSIIKGREEYLENLVSITKDNERCHMYVFFPITAAANGLVLLAENYEGTGYLFSSAFAIVNIAANVYPSMNLRYIRNKANRLLEILKEREERKHSNVVA